jgi:hypothetical protein
LQTSGPWRNGSRCRVPACAFWSTGGKTEIAPDDPRLTDRSPAELDQPMFAIAPAQPVVEPARWPISVKQP